MRIYCKIFFLISSICPVTACTDFDPIDGRVATINESVANYANEATLLNVIRAKNAEPLTFVSLTGLTGADAISSQIGLPVNFGPHLHTSPRGYALGPNSVTRGNTNTYSVSVLDDPTSYAALLSPVTPATIGFFIREGYERSILFFLLTAEIDELVVDNKTKKITGIKQVYYNDPPCDPKAANCGRKNTDFKNFTDLMASFLAKGLTAEIDGTSIPVGRSLPPSKLCISPRSKRGDLGEDFLTDYKYNYLSPKPGSDIQMEGDFVDKLTENIKTTLLNNIPQTDKTSLPSRKTTSTPPIDSSTPPTDLCIAADWIESQSVQGSTNSGSGGSANGSGGNSALISAADGSVWAIVGNKIIRASTSNGVTTPTTIFPNPNPDKSQSNNIAQPAPSRGFLFQDDHGNYYSLILRSPYAAYEYIGQMINHDCNIAATPRVISGASKSDNRTTSERRDYCDAGNGLQVIRPDEAGAHFIKITNGPDIKPDIKCFARVTYKENDYCVPDNSQNSKRLFNIIHQLFELNAAPSNTSATLSITAAPN